MKRSRINDNALIQEKKGKKEKNKDEDVKPGKREIEKKTKIKEEDKKEELSVTDFMNAHITLLEVTGDEPFATLPAPEGQEGYLVLTERKLRKRITIEKLVLENFKSYAGVKVIGPFYKKFSCIVGPNGSGKSNIIDAMLFVFGRRAKKIRQNKLSDLIHASQHSGKRDYTKVSIYFKTIKEEIRVYINPVADEKQKENGEGEGEGAEQEEGDEKKKEKDNELINHIEGKLEKEKEGNNKKEQKHNTGTLEEGKEKEENRSGVHGNKKKEGNENGTTTGVGIGNGGLNSETKETPKIKREYIEVKELEYDENDEKEDDGFKDFSISREATIDNQSKYRINDKAVTQKDVFDLLYKKGIDLNNNRFLILQGEVEQIAQMNPKGSKNEDGLLEYMEEIIGTNRYMGEINDLLQKLDKQNELFQEKVNSVKYVHNELKELAGPKKEAQYFMALQKFTYQLHVIMYKKELHGITKGLKSRSEELKAVEEKKKENDELYQKFLKEKKVLNEKLDELNEEKKDLKVKKESIEPEFRDLNILDNTKKKRIANLAERLQNSYIQREELKQKIPEYENIILKKKELVEQLTKNIPEWEAQLDDTKDALYEYDRKIKNELDTVKEVLTKEEIVLAPLQEKCDKFSQIISESENSIMLIERKKNEFFLHLEGLKNTHSKIVNELREADIQLKHMLKIQEEKKKILEEKQKELEKTEKEGKCLSDKYVEESVKVEVMKKEVLVDGVKSKLQEFITDLKKKMKGLHGFLGDLGYIDKKYEKAFLVAGSNCTDFVIVESPNDAIQLFEQVRKAGLGRVNVLSISALEDSLMNTMKHNETNFKPVQPNVKRLIDFINFKNEKFKICFYFALKETLLANNLEEAHVIGFKFKKRVVTVKGELIENDGRLCGGGTTAEAKTNRGNVSIKTTEYDRIDVLKAEGKVREINKQIKENNEKKIILGRQIREITDFIDENDGKIQIAKSTIDSHKLRLKDVGHQIDKAETPEYTNDELKEMNNLKKLIQETKDKKEQIDIEIKVQEEIIKGIHRELAKVGGEERKEIKNKIINIERQINKAKDDIKLYKREEFDAGVELRRTNDKLKFLNTDIDDFEKEEQELEEELKKIEDKASIIFPEVEKCEMRLKNIEIDIKDSLDRKKEVDKGMANIELENVDIDYKTRRLNNDILFFKEEEKRVNKKIKEYTELMEEAAEIVRKSLNYNLRNKVKIKKKKRKRKSVHRYGMEDQNQDKNEEIEGEKEKGEEGEKEEEEEEDEEDEDEDDDEDDDEEEDEEEENDEENDKKDDEENNIKETGTDLQKTKSIGLDIVENREKKTENYDNKKNVEENVEIEVDEEVILDKTPEEKKAEEEEEKELKELERAINENADISIWESEFKGVDLTEDDLENISIAYIKERIKKNIEMIEKEAPNFKVFKDVRIKVREYIIRKQDLEKTKRTKNKIKYIYNKVCKKRKEEFLKAFNIISVKLKEMYQMIAIGGDAELELIDSSDIFSEGVLFSVRPPKKSWKHIQNLSGGEKTLSSLALVFALHYFKPNPIYFMDEIDAALDFRNVSIISHYIKTKTDDAQFIVISLRNQMFELCDRMIGIYKTNDETKCITINPTTFSPSDLVDTDEEEDNEEPSVKPETQQLEDIKA